MPTKENASRDALDKQPICSFPRSQTLTSDSHLLLFRCTIYIAALAIHYPRGENMFCPRSLIQGGSRVQLKIDALALDSTPQPEGPEADQRCPHPPGPGLVSEGTGPR